MRFNGNKDKSFHRTLSANNKTWKNIVNIEDIPVLSFKQRVKSLKQRIEENEKTLREEKEKEKKEISSNNYLRLHNKQFTRGLMSTSNNKLKYDPKIKKIKEEIRMMNKNSLIKIETSAGPKMAKFIKSKLKYKLNEDEIVDEIKNNINKMKKRTLLKSASCNMHFNSKNDNERPLNNSKSCVIFKLKEKYATKPNKPDKPNKMKNILLSPLSSIKKPKCMDQKYEVKNKINFVEEYLKIFKQINKAKAKFIKNSILSSEEIESLIKTRKEMRIMALKQRITKGHEQMLNIEEITKTLRRNNKDYTNSKFNINQLTNLSPVNNTKNQLKQNFIKKLTEEFSKELNLFNITILNEE